MKTSVYESYKAKCKELGLKPSTKNKLLAEDIIKEKNKSHIDIAAKSLKKKQKPLILSKTAKGALVINEKKKHYYTKRLPKSSLLITASIKIQKREKAIFPKLFPAFASSAELIIKKPKVIKKALPIQRKDIEKFREKFYFIKIGYIDGFKYFCRETNKEVSKEEMENLTKEVDSYGTT